MPDPAVLTDLGRSMLADLPGFLRDDPDYQGVIHAYAKEIELLEGRLQGMVGEFFAQTATEKGMRIWEAELQLPIEPAGRTLEERRTIVLAYLARLSGDPSGRSWVENVTQLIGPGWTYVEHDPHDPLGPPEYTLRIHLNLDPGSPRWGDIYRLLREITPAHLELALVGEGGFVLDISHLDEETFAW